MTAAERSAIARELGKAQDALERARRTATVVTDHMLARRLRIAGEALADEILKLHGGPVKIAGTDLIST